MRNPEKDAIEIAAKRQKLMETGFLLFSQRTIDQVSLEEIARKSGVGIATLYRYFGTKLELVIAISVWQWTQYRQQFEQELDTDRNYKTAAQEYAFFLDFFLEMYRNHKELLRFNQFFNIFIEGTGVEQGLIAPYTEIADWLAERFRRCWERGARDGTIKTDTPWMQAYTGTLHLMLAAVTRYAVGLVYQPQSGNDPEQELLLLREMLLRQYTK